MNFINEQINEAAIPDAQLVNWQPVEKDYLKVLRIQWLIVSVILLVIAVVLLVLVQSFRQVIPFALISGSWLFICAFYFIVMEKSFKQLAYAIREHDILYRRGWLVQTMIACPYNRIQHCSADAGLLDRKYKLSSLTLFTAGANAADLRISGIKEEMAQKLREFIMQKIKTDEQATG
jgi:membrane protein YdbS with pleckstrin-like domain